MSRLARAPSRLKPACARRGLSAAKRAEVTRQLRGGREAARRSIHLHFHGLDPAEVARIIRQQREDL